MSASLPPAGFEEIHRAEFARTFGRIVGTRLYVGPVAAVFAMALGLSEPAPWRRAVLFVLGLLIIGISVAEALRYRRRGMAPRAVDLNLGVGALGQLVGSAATGGLESPFAPLVLLIALMLGIVMTERRWYYWALHGLQLASSWVFAAIAAHGWIPEFNLHLFGGGERAGHPDALLWTAAAFLTLGILGADRLGRVLRGVFDSMLRRALEANEGLRREHAERSRELVALSGEIAHELKNPMSSVKGLAALLAQNVEEAKGAERLGVLRREVDRMQGVLEEFLNFSRPLVPLSLERADLAALCQEVAALHEGIAGERSVSLAVRGRPASVRCDPRKVRQVLINLAQNAVEASPVGGAVEIECEGDGAGAVVRVLDRGPGIDPAVAERLFQPGATTKPKGTGLGLTIARALARQHGGELVLESRDGGGCRAELRLPSEAEGAGR